MIIKAVYGDSEFHCRVLEVKDIHIEGKGHYTEVVCHGVDDGVPTTLHLGEHSTDHLYIMDKGETVDHFVF